MDWNNDGKKDLITGEHYGTVRIYLNTNTDESPIFQGYSYLQVNQANFDCGSDSMPHVVDWNSDGRKDLLCGEIMGKVLLLLNVGTDADPVFDTSVFLKDGAVDLDVGNYASPTVADWNRDGKKDLIAGNRYGKISFFENKGTDESPLFSGSVLLDASVYSYAHLDLTDWDGDQVMDILCGDYQGYAWIFRVLGPLSLSDNRLSESTGGTIDLSLNAGLPNANREYLVLGSISGTEPGIPLPGGQTTLPLNYDLFFGLVLNHLNSPAFINFMGSLDGDGRSQARFNTLGPRPGTAGMDVSFAFALHPPWDYASNGATIEIVP